MVYRRTLYHDTTSRNDLSRHISALAVTFYSGLYMNFLYTQPYCYVMIPSSASDIDYILDCQWT